MQVRKLKKVNIISVNLKDVVEIAETMQEPINIPAEDWFNAAPTIKNDLQDIIATSIEYSIKEYLKENKQYLFEEKLK